MQARKEATVADVKEVHKGDTVLVPRGALGNARAFRMRIEEVKRTETRRNGRIYVQVYGFEVTKAGETRRYFGHRYSEFFAWLGPDDYEVIAQS